MESKEIRKKFLEFFKSRGHTVVPSSSLIPDDPSVLLTTAGMQQFKKYFTGEADPIKDFGSKNTTSIQKSFRTSDIDEVGDESHLTFFEMLGNFSFGGYGKKEAIKYAHEFITKELGLSIAYVTIFAGDEKKGIQLDEESERIWQIVDSSLEIRMADIHDNFWGPTGSEGPCGPTTEIYCKNGAGQDIEIWNIVFNEFFFPGSREELLSGILSKKLTPLPTLGVDTGMGLERLAMIAQGKNNIFETDLFEPIIEFLNEHFSQSRPEWSKRIIADHARSIVFLIADGVQSSNKDRGYILRRLMRRAIPHSREFQFIDKSGPGEKVKIKLSGIESVVKLVIDEYSKIEGYAYLSSLEEEILNVVREENELFNRAYERGREVLDKIIDKAISGGIKKIPGKDIFHLVTTYGFSLEWIKDMTKIHDLDLNPEEFEDLFKKHQKISRAGIEKKFGGHGLILNTGELKATNEEEVKIVTRLHTATHLLQAALRVALGPEVEQRGSDITAERTRFDFSFPRKLTDEEKKQVEDWVNDVINRNLSMTREEMSYEKAIKSGALHFFREKYPERVDVYSVVDQKSGEVISRELCGGPHVARTGEIGHFRITKEEAVSAGTRRMRAVVE